MKDANNSEHKKTSTTTITLGRVTGHPITNECGSSRTTRAQTHYLHHVYDCHPLWRYMDFFCLIEQLEELLEAEEYYETRDRQFRDMADSLPIEYATILAQVMAGQTHQEIADYLGIDRSKVTTKIKFLTDLLHRLVLIGWNDIDRDHPNIIIRAYLKHLTLTRTTLALGYSYRRVRYAVDNELERTTDPKLKQVLQGLKGLKLPRVHGKRKHQKHVIK